VSRDLFLGSLAKTTAVFLTPPQNLVVVEDAQAVELMGEFEKVSL